jgi:hypothetical protein
MAPGSPNLEPLSNDLRVSGGLRSASRRCLLGERLPTQLAEVGHLLASVGFRKIGAGTGKRGCRGSRLDMQLLWAQLQYSTNGLRVFCALNWFGVPEAERTTRARIPSADPAADPASYPEPCSMPMLPYGNDDENWSIRTVAQKTGLPRASIYRYVARNLFQPRRTERGTPYNIESHPMQSTVRVLLQSDAAELTVLNSLIGAAGPTEFGGASVGLPAGE